MFFRNKELKRDLVVWMVITAGASIAAWVAAARFGIAVLILCLLFGILHFAVTCRRYQKIAGIANEIDRILHGANKYNMVEYEEGELRILQNEVQKLTVRLQNQASLLKADKQYLADSMADISHQLRTPLTSLNLISDFLLEPDLSGERRLELMKQQCRLLSQMEWLINTLLKISKLDAGTLPMKQEQVCVRRLLQKATEPISIAMDLKNQQLFIDCGQEVSFTGDFLFTAEAVENIVKNCMEHTKEGGMIRITGNETAIYTEIVIEDNGPGIAPEDLSHIFERFYKGKNASESSVGIGLALARMIIVNENGTIKVENVSPHGSRFMIRFYKGCV